MPRNRQEERPAAAPTLSIPLSEELIAAIAARIEARPAKRLYNVPETAIYLGRTESAIREMLRSGKLKRANRDDRRVMFDRYDLDAWIEAGK